MKSYLGVLLIAIVVALFIYILDVPNHIYIVLILSTIISLIVIAIKEGVKKRA